MDSTAEPATCATLTLTAQEGVTGIIEHTGSTPSRRRFLRFSGDPMFEPPPPYDFSVVAARLVEAACCARDGDGERAKAHIAHAVALLHGQPGTATTAIPPLRLAPRVLRGSLAAWQARRLTTYIDTHLSARIRIEHLAELLGLSIGHFCRAFKRTFGVSAHDFVTRRRIAVAQGLMVTTTDPLSAIALSCGMSDQSHFTRSFRRIVGETPYSWRRTHRGELE